MARRVVQQQQDLLARHLVAPPRRPGLQTGRDLLGGEPGGQQQAGQRIGRIHWPLAGCMGVQRQEKLPVRKGAGQPVRRVHRKGGLPDPRHPVDRVNAHHHPARGLAVDSVQQPCQFATAAGEGGTIPRQGPGRRRPGWGGQVQQGVGGEHSFMHAAEPRAWLDAQLGIQHLPGVVEHRQRLGLAAGPVQREHQLPAQPLPQRMLGYQLPQLGAYGGVLAEGQRGFDPVLGRQQPQLGQPLDLEPGERLELQVGQRPAAPQRLRLTQQHRRPARVALLQRVPSRGHPLLEHLQVQLPGLDPQQIPGRTGQHPRLAVAVGEDLAQPGDLHPQHPLRRAPLLIAEQLVDQLVTRDHLVGVAQQHAQQGPLPRPANAQQRSAAPDLQRPQDPELQPSAHLHSPGLSVLPARECWLAAG